MRDLYVRAGLDPKSVRADAHLRAHALAGAAELARCDGSGTVDHWVRTAASWNKLARPHDAAYCHWRAARVAQREGQGTVTTRLLERAATEAREHVPLSAAVAGATTGVR